MTSRQNSESAIARRKAYDYEYHRRPEVMAKKRELALEQTRLRNVINMKKKLEELTMGELIYIASSKCAETGVSYEENKEAIEKVLRILHGES